MKNIRIEYNKEIIDKFKDINIAADHIGSVAFVLFCIYENRKDLLDHFDDKNTLRRVLILYKQMERRNLINENKQLTKKGALLVEFVKSKFDNIEATSFKQEIAAESFTDYDWVQEYVNTFPKDRRDNVKVVALRMKKFIEEFNFDKDIILKAAKMYNRHHDQQGTALQYRRRSQYFIFEGKGDSRTYDLASWCDKALENNSEPNNENLDLFEMI